MYENYTEEQLQQMLRTALNDRRDLFFARLLGGDAYTEAEAAEAGREVAVEFSCAHYYLLSARVETWGAMYHEGELDHGDVSFILRNTLQNAFFCKSEAAWIQGCMVAILNPDTAGEETLKQIKKQAEAALTTLEEAFGISVSIAISRACDSLLALPRGMEDIKRIFEYLQFLDTDIMVAAYDDFRYPFVGKEKKSYVDLFNRMISNLRAADFVQLQITLHDLVDREFLNPKPSIDTFRISMSGLANTMLFLMDELREIIGNDVVDMLNVGPKLTEATTLVELLSAMDNILETLVRYGNERGGEYAEWVSRVYDHVCKGYRDPDLTVASVADHFHITPTYCARQFKEKYQVRLFDFIQLRRMEQAKALMRTGKSLHVIAAESGFSSALTMCRAFKRYEGIAPKEYREHMQQTYPAVQEIGNVPLQ